MFHHRLQARTTRPQRERHHATAGTRTAFRPALEALEDRAVPAAVYWALDADGDWEVARNWSTGRVPAPGDEVFLDTPSGTAHTITHGSGYHYAGTIQASNTTLRLTGGTIQVQTAARMDSTLHIDGGHLTLQGVFTTTADVVWTSGRVSTGGGRLHNTGTLTLEGSALKTLDSANARRVGLTNAGYLFHTGTGALELGTFTTLTNLVGGVYDLQTNASLLGRGIVVNEGLLVKSGGDGNSSFTPEMMNTGTLGVGAGTLTFGDNQFYRFTQTAGSTFLYGGTLAVVTTLDLQGGRLEGSGTINGNVRNAGVLEPGGTGAVGALQINGNYTQALSGTLVVEVASVEAYDWLYVNGQANLSGTLNLTLLDGATLAAWDFFYGLLFNTRTGTFTTLNVPDLGPELYFLPSYDEFGLNFWVVPVE